MEAAPDEAIEIQVEANGDEVGVHDPIAGEVVRVVFSKLPDKQFFQHEVDPDKFDPLSMALFTKGPLLETLINVINAGEPFDAKYKKAEAYLEKKNFDGCLSTVQMKDLDLGKLNEICGSQFKTYDVHGTSPRLVTQRKNSWREGPLLIPSQDLLAFSCPSIYACTSRRCLSGS